MSDETISARGGAPAGAWLARLSSPAATLLLVAAAIAGQAAGHIDSDVSWFITLAEKFLDGTSLYDRGDIVEPNPPLSFLSLTPAVALARAAHVSPEFALTALVFLFAFGVLALCGHILRIADRIERGLLLNGAIWILLVMPALVFAQREHIALLAMAPLLANLSAPRRRQPLAFSALLGLGGALAAAFKPFFGLPVAAAVLALCWRERSLRPLLRAELIACGMFVFAYIGAVGFFFPLYFARIVPFGVDVYSPAHENFEKLATETLFPVYAALCAGLLALARSAPRGPLAWTAFWASVGFFISFAMQRKGWINHAYPSVALLMLAWLAFIIEETRVAGRGLLDRPLVKYFFLPAFVAAPFFFAAARQWSDAEEYPGLAAAVAAHAPAHPRLIALAINCDVGHPLTRHVQGVWVGRPCSLWTSSYVGRVLETGAADKDAAYRARLLDYRHADLAAFAQDAEAGRADAVIVESKELRDWAATQPELAAVLAPFEKVATAGAVELWTRRR
jgi:hypothetical protein